MVGYLPFGLLPDAAIARSTEVWAAWSGTVPIYGGSAHLTLVEMLRSGAGLWAAVGAALLINARLSVYSSALMPLWGTAGGVARLLAAAVANAGRVGGDGRGGGRDACSLVVAVGYFSAVGDGCGGTMRRPGLAEVVVLTWIAVIAVRRGSYAFRLTPLLLGARVLLPQTTQDLLRHAGMGGMAALLVSSVVGFGTSGGLAAIASAGAATAAAGVVAWRGRSMAVVVLAGGAVYAVIALAFVILG